MEDSDSVNGALIYGGIMLTVPGRGYGIFPV